VKGFESNVIIIKYQLYYVVENISQKEEFTPNCSDVFQMHIGK